MFCLRLWKPFRLQRHHHHVNPILHLLWARAARLDYLESLMHWYDS